MSAYKLFTFLFLLISPFVFSQNTIKHKVTKGESIYLIAKKYQVKQTAIYALNPGIEGEILQLNTVLLIPSKEQNQLNNSLSTAKEHTVVSGESLYKISRKYGISVQELARLNPTVVEKLPIGYHLILKEEVPIIEVDTTNYAVIPEIVKDSTNIAVEPTKTTVLLETAFENLGAKYKRGGTTPNGFDCSGFIYTTFKEIDITLPRSSRDQAKIGTKINRSEAKKGDLIFFATNGKKNINHVGLITEIIGDEIKFIHSSTSLGVIISSTKEAYYARTFKQINTILQSFF
jgi:cell wall-associated NlpC family hydrolase